MKRVVLCLILWTIFHPGLGITEEKLILTLEKSLALALKQNPEIKMAEKEVAKAKAGIGEALSSILPQLDATANFQHDWAIQESTIPNFIKEGLGDLAPPGLPDFLTLSFGLENTLSYGAQIRQALFLGGAGIAGIQTARAAKKGAEQYLEAKKQDLILQSANGFYSILLAKELVNVQEEAFSQAKANLDMVNKKYRVGMASGFDKMRAEVEVANLEPGIISARNNYRSSLTYFRNILGLSKEVIIEISGDFKFAEDDFGQMKLPDLHNMATKNRPEILALEQQKRMTKEGIIIARSNFLPKLYFQTNYSFLAMKNDLKFKQGDFSKGFTSSISLQIPLFHGFRSSRLYQKAKLDHKILIDTEKQVKNGVFAEVEISLNKFQEAKQKYLSTQRTVKLAEEALRLANLMYDEGANTQLDVLNSQLALTQARMNYVSSLYEYQISRYQLRRVTGTLKGVL